MNLSTLNISTEERAMLRADAKAEVFNGTRGFTHAVILFQHAHHGGMIYAGLRLIPCGLEALADGPSFSLLDIIHHKA